jgi:glycosyltransferase involved in cell wall biosynthesis
VPFFWFCSFAIYDLGFTIKKMRILQINSAKNFGGGEKHFVDLTSGLINRGHELFLAVAPDSPILERLTEFQNENILQVKIKNALDVFASQKIAKFVRKNKIEIVHAHTGKDYLPASLAVRFASNAKLVLTRHVLFSLKNAQKYSLKNVSKVIAVSSAVEANLQKTFPKEKIVTIPNGIDVENWANVDRKRLREEFRFENNISFDAQVLGTVGELKNLKGQQDFILAAQIVAKKYPETHFIIVGKDNSYDKSFRRELKRLVKTFDLEKQFSWFDWIEDTKPLLSSLDLFISSSHSESFGLAILEAMASGCAVISTETEGAKELLENGKSGFLTSIKNPVKLAESICELLENKENIVELGENAQKQAKENFGLEKMILETEKVYKGLI